MFGGKLVPVEHAVGQPPALGEPGERRAAREGDVGVDVEEREARRHRGDGGVLVHDQELGRRAHVRGAVAPDLPARPGLRQDPVDDLGPVARLVSRPGMRPMPERGARAARVDAHPCVSATHELGNRLHGAVREEAEGPAKLVRPPVARLPEDRRNPLSLGQPLRQVEIDGDPHPVAHGEVARGALDTAVGRLPRLVWRGLGDGAIRRLRPLEQARAPPGSAGRGRGGAANARALRDDSHRVCIRFSPKAVQHPRGSRPLF